ncbi:hypothetical protein ACFWIB_04405 [Streptomyces sp. NPDC127051]|uniref:hypothetical protein n=1 Tax=Streptomyces sp. NPDC127051 TaxID=3347119 RepID=UPI0036669DDF
MSTTVYAPVNTALALPQPPLDIFDADQRTRIPAAAALAAITSAPAAPATFTTACRREELPPLTPRAIAVLVDIAEMKEEGLPPEMVKFWNFVAGLIWRAGDSKAVLEEVAQLISGAHAEAEQ